MFNRAIILYSDPVEKVGILYYSNKIITTYYVKKKKKSNVGRFHAVKSVTLINLDVQTQPGGGGTN